MSTLLPPVLTLSPVCGGCGASFDRHVATGRCPTRIDNEPSSPYPAGVSYLLPADAQGIEPDVLATTEKFRAGVELANLWPKDTKPSNPEPAADTISATLDERGKRYGKFTGHAAITQLLKANMHAHPGWKALEPDQKEALEMIAHKIGRVLNGDPNYDDSWVDIAGYAKLVADRLQGAAR